MKDRIVKAGKYFNGKNGSPKGYVLMRAVSVLKLRDRMYGPYFATKEQAIKYCTLMGYRL